MSSSAPWLQASGWWLPSKGGDNQAKPTHLLLDKGKARVPDESADAFLSAYALAVVKKLSPCFVELRTPVFKLFLDLDIKTRADEDLDFEAVMRVLQAQAVEFFSLSEPPRAVVCTTPPRQLPDGCTKAGRHVVWTNIAVSSPTALAFRQAVLERLGLAMPNACANAWTMVVDKCVFEANGLRMAFSGKGLGNPATYEPAAVWIGEESVAVDPPSGVAAIRGWALELSIRMFRAEETPVREGVRVELAANDTGGGGVKGVAKSLETYAGVLPLLDAALPVEFVGQRFTGLLQTETCFMLRSSSQYCQNLGRRHNSNNVFFVLTPEGICQHCFCRCETVEGRKHGLCKNFRSDVWPVPREVVAAFFGSASAAPVAVCRGMSTRDTLVARVTKDMTLHSRPQHKPRGGRKKKRV